MVSSNEQQERPQQPRNAGLEEGLGLTNSGMNMMGFNAIMELARGSTKAEEYMVRSSYTPWEIHIRALEAECISQCDGFTDTDMSNWLEDHMKPAIGGKRVQQIVDMVIAATNRQQPTPQPSGFERASGTSPTPGSIR